MRWLGGDRHLLSELVSIFVDDGPKRLQAIRAALTASDVRQVEHVAHSLKGSAAILGATGLQTAAVALEDAAHDGHTENGSGLGAGADDYIVKPFEREELRARVQVGFRMLALQAALADRVRELEEALTRVKQLQGLLPICSYCKKVRDDRNYWQQVETYIEGHSDAQFTHGICPECREKYVEPELERLRRIREARPPGTQL